MKRTYSSLPQPVDWIIMDYAKSAEQESSSAQSIMKHIKAIVDDPEQYAEEESAPSQSAVDSARILLESATIPETVHPEVTVYYGEIDITWQAKGKLVRLIVFSDSRTPQIYFHVDAEAILTRGHCREATTEFLNERLQWLLTERCLDFAALSDLHVLGFNAEDGNLELSTVGATFSKELEHDSPPGQAL